MLKLKPFHFSSELKYVDKAALLEGPVLRGMQHL